MPTPRRVFVPTREQRNQVCIMVAAKWTEVMICQDLSISPSILRKHFKDELANGALQVRSRAIFAIAQEAFAKKDPSIPALKAIVALATETEPTPPGGRKAPVVREAEMRLGKKVKDKIAAEAENRGLFETPKPPSLKTVQ